MRQAFLIFALTVTAGALPGQNPRARVWLPGFTTQTALDTMTAPEELDAPYGKVYTAVIAAFDEMKIPLDTRDSSHGLVGNLTLTRRGSLAGSQMSRWLNCGTGITGPNADNWRIYIAVAALLDRVTTTNKTQLRVAMLAGAQDMQGNSKDPVVCASSGGIETKVLELVKKKISAP
jgi:hypothetical protein